METNATASAASDRAQAQLFLASAFAEIMLSQDGDLELMEGACVAAGHELMAAAFGLTLERLDGALRSQLAQGGFAPRPKEPHDRHEDGRRPVLVQQVPRRLWQHRRPARRRAGLPWCARISPPPGPSSPTTSFPTPSARPARYVWSRTALTSSSRAPTAGPSRSRP